MTNAMCRRAALLLLALAPTACLSHPVKVVDRVDEESPRRIDPERVAIFTDVTGPPRRPYRRMAGLVVRLHKGWGFGYFDYLRALRRRAGELGCSAIIVGSRTEVSDEILCGGRDASPVACFYEYRASCIELD